MTCDEALDRMLEADPAELRGEAETGLARHIAGCHRCRAVAAAMLEETAAVDDALAGYAAGGRFEHDPALPRPPIPKLADIHALGAMEDRAPERLPFLVTRLRRRANQVANAFFEAARVARRARAALVRTGEIELD